VGDGTPVQHEGIADDQVGLAIAVEIADGKRDGSALRVGNTGEHARRCKVWDGTTVGQRVSVVNKSDQQDGRHHDRDQ